MCTPHVPGKQDVASEVMHAPYEVEYRTHAVRKKGMNTFPMFSSDVGGAKEKENVVADQTLGLVGETKFHQFFKSVLELPSEVRAMQRHGEKS